MPNASIDEEGKVIPVLHWDELDELDILLCGVGNPQAYLHLFTTCSAHKVKEGEIRNVD